MVGEIEVRDAEIEGSSYDGALAFECVDAAEVGESYLLWLELRSSQPG